MAFMYARKNIPIQLSLLYLCLGFVSRSKKCVCKQHHGKNANGLRPAPVEATCT